MSNKQATLKKCRIDDTKALAAVYRDAVLKLGRRAYNEDQLRVWAHFAEDLEAFSRTLSAGLTLCMVVDGTPVAFGQLEPVDYIALLYCHSSYARRGYASAILRELEKHAMEAGVSMLQVAASCVARPFFEHHGYRVTAEEHPRRHGVELLRYRMVKTLA